MRIEDHLMPGESVEHRADLHWWVWAVGVVLAPFTCGLSVLFAWLEKRNTEIVVTNRRLVIKKGAFVPKVQDLRLDKIETVDVDMTSMGYGNLAFTGTGGATTNLMCIVDPMALRNAVYSSQDLPGGDAEVSRDTEWDELPSKEKIRRVEIKPLPFRSGQELDGGSRSKRFRVRVTPQAPDCFEYDEHAAVDVSVFSRGRQHALDTVAEAVSGRDCYVDNDRAFSGECGRWYDGNKCRLEILPEDAVDP